MFDILNIFLVMPPFSDETAATGGRLITVTWYPPAGMDSTWQTSSMSITWNALPITCPWETSPVSVTWRLPSTGTITYSEGEA